MRQNRRRVARRRDVDGAQTPENHLFHGNHRSQYLRALRTRALARVAFAAIRVGWIMLSGTLGTLVATTVMVHSHVIDWITMAGGLTHGAMLLCWAWALRRMIVPGRHAPSGHRRRRPIQDER